MTIKARLIVTISVLIAAAFLCIGVVTVTVIRSRMIDRVDRALLETPLRPGRFEGQGGDPDQFSERQASSRQTLAEGFSLQVLHHQVGPSFGEPGVEQRADMRMVQRPDRPAFTGEPLPRLLDFLPIVRDDLECHETVEPGVLRLEDFAHPTRAE